MSDRARVLLVLLIVALVGGGAIFYFFKIYRPAQDLKAAQAELDTWEKRYQETRVCLLGKTPGSSKTSEALAIREMRGSDDPWDRKSCTPLISKLSRGGGEDTGLPAVEQAWNDLDKAASKAALAFAEHVSESTTLEHDPLPAALDALDAARNKLRALAKLPESAGAGTPLPVAQTLPIGDGKGTLTSLVVDAIPSAHGLVLFGKTDSRTVQVVLGAGLAPKAMAIGPSSLRAVPDMTWGATPSPTDVQAGAMDAEGAMTTPTTLAMVAPTIATVAGTLQDGVVIYGNPTDVVVARAKGGVVTPGTPMKIQVAEATADIDGRSALVWGTAEKTQGQIFKPGSADEPVVELPQLGRLCMTADRVWGQHGSVAVSFGGGRPVFKKELGPPAPEHARVEIYGTGPRPELGSTSQGYSGEPDWNAPTNAPQLQGCTADAALFHDHARPSELVICTDDCRTAKIPSGAPQFATTTVVGGKLVAIASHSGVLGVWREGAPQPVFYAVSNDASPVLAHEWPAMALTDGKVIDVLSRGEKSFVVIRVPAN
jgi:hypothetical protein